MSTPEQTSVPQLGKLVSVLYVGLKEAALDSPTFRATTLHFAEQIECIERWLDGYTKSTLRLIAELSSFEQVITTFLSSIPPPLNISEAILDHDYTQLAVKKNADCARDHWNAIIALPKKLEHLAVEPIRTFMQGDLRNFKETRRVLDHTQKQYDHLQARYSSQAKSKEPSSLREDAFQLHEARKAYLKASMDFAFQAPQVRSTLDKLLVRVSFDQWRETRVANESIVTSFTRCGREMERIKGWLHETENGERFSRRELATARKQIEEAAELAARPSRELEDYSVATVPYLGSRAPSTFKRADDKPFKPEKQGWLSLRTFTGKPTRTIWVRRWAILRNGVFGCLISGTRTGGVVESERIGVLLCSIRPAFQEERRFCFEVKTKKNTIMLQAETQKELMDWIGAFEAAKQRALENPMSSNLSVPGKTAIQDAAFSISQPPALEFAADPSDSLTLSINDDPTLVERNGNLLERDSLAVKSSDLISSRRSTGLDGEAGNGREHGQRIIQKLDLHRRPNAVASQQHPLTMSPVGGVAGPSSVNNSSTPYNGSMAIISLEHDSVRDSAPNYTSREVAAMSLAPPTFANPPAPTSMSMAAVKVAIERGIGLGFADSTGDLPSGMMANLWGCANLATLNMSEHDRLRPTEGKMINEKDSPPKFLTSPATDFLDQAVTSESEIPGENPQSRLPVPAPGHKQTVGLDGDASGMQRSILNIPYEYPSFYPQQLRVQDAQFRLLFPYVKRDESLLLVFRATWNLNDQQDFPGRAYITTSNMYFYSNHFGLVLTTSNALSNITEVTAAPGRDCDFLFLHVAPSTTDGTLRRITVKTFLEPLRLLQRRMNFLIKDAAVDKSQDLEAIVRTLIKIEIDKLARTPSMDSWEDVSLDTPVDIRAAAGGNLSRRSKKGIQPPIYLERDYGIGPANSSSGKNGPKFKLPAQPVQYVPQGHLHLAAEKVFDISSKALFHVLFGDKSAVWQHLLYERMAQDIKQGPWRTLDSRHMRRDFEYRIEKADLLGRLYRTTISDYQIIDVLNDHLCYVVTDKRTPWHLPFKRSFRLVSKIVITYVSKSRSRLAIFTKVEWLWSNHLSKRLVDKQASNDLKQDALDLLDLAADQVQKLGLHGRTKKAITTFGHVGRHEHVSQFAVGDMPSALQFRKPRKQRSLALLFFDSLGSLLESALSSLMIWTYAFLRWIWRTCTANSLILLLLLLSILTNGLYSTRDVYDWWHERNAAAYLSRLGIGPENVMNKAIYIKDVDEAIANTTLWRNPSGNSGSCFSTFNERMLTNGDALLMSTKSRNVYATTKDAAWRLQRTRQRLGMYRHDLVVALRVINTIERELLHSEWESWLDQETRRCNQVQALLKKAGGSPDMGNDADLLNRSLFAGYTEDVARWYEDYCVSCQREKEQVEREASLD